MKFAFQVQDDLKFWHRIRKSSSKRKGKSGDGNCEKTATEEGNQDSPSGQTSQDAGRGNEDEASVEPKRDDESENKDRNNQQQQPGNEEDAKVRMEKKGNLSGDDI